MSRIALASVAGAPGVSTLVSAMALTSTQATLVVECAPDGGVFAVRWGLPRAVTLADLAIDTAADDELWERAQPWMGVTRLLPADASPVAMQRAPAVRYVADRLGGVEVPTLLDLGRLRADEATLELLSRVDRLWLLVEPTVEHVTVATAWRPLLERTAVELLVVDRPASSGSYPVREIVGTLGWPCIGTLRRDRRGALALRGVGAPTPWLLERLPLVRQARDLRGRIGSPQQEVGV